MSNLMFKVGSKIASSGKLGILKRIPVVSMEEVEEGTEDSYPSDSEFTYIVSYSNDGVEGKIVSLTSIDEINREIANPDLDYEMYTISVSVGNEDNTTTDPVPTSNDILTNSKQPVTDTIPDTSQGLPDSSGEPVTIDKEVNT